MTRRKRYLARYERDDESKAWLVHIDGVDSCHTHGRTLAQAAERIEEALAAWLDTDPARFELEHRWPDELVRVAEEVRVARRRAAEATQAAARTVGIAADRLSRMGLSRRDAASVLGISHQRVQQLRSR